MATWLYQMSQALWTPQKYRVDIWEGERWSWPVGKKTGGTPQPGDIVVFFFAQAGGREPGFYGWGVVLDWEQGSVSQLRFRPVAPSDYLKMNPWWNTKARQLADQIRGRVKQGTLWQVSEKEAEFIRHGFTTWLAGMAIPERSN